MEATEPEIVTIAGRECTDPDVLAEVDRIAKANQAALDEMMAGRE